MRGVQFLHAGRYQGRKFFARAFPGGIRRVGGEQIRQGRAAVGADGAVERQRHVAPPAEKVPITISGEIYRDPMEPGRQRRISAEAGQVPVRAHERVLGDFFGVGVIVQKAMRDGEDLGLVTAHDLDEGGLVPIDKLADELHIRRGFIRFRGLYSSEVSCDHRCGVG